MARRTAHRAVRDTVGRQATAWVEAGEILPLLDGLDEVVGARRDECVAAIATFHARQPLTPIVVCCREAEYQALRSSLPVYGTVTIEPLTRPQIERHLDRAGPALAGLRAALAADEELWGFTGSPLLLSIMALAYADGPGPRTGTGSRRDRLFARYAETMLRHRPHPGYRPEQATRYLSLLGDRMRARQQSIFVLDLVGPDWSPSWPLRDARPDQPDRDPASPSGWRSRSAGRRWPAGPAWPPARWPPP